MSETHKFIVVDEYDNVFGYYESREDAVSMAAGESEDGCRDTFVYAITEVAVCRCNGEEDE